MGLRIRMGDAAGHLSRLDMRREEREQDRFVIPWLPIETIPVNRPTVKTRRRPRLQAPQRQTESIDPLGKTNRRTVANSSPRALPVPNMDDAAQKGACGQNHGPGRQFASIGKNDACNATLALKKIGCLPFDDLEPRLRAQSCLHRLTIELPVSLSPRPLYCGALTAVQKAKLDSRAVSGPAHDAIEGIDFPHEMAFPEPANRRIAGHDADPVPTQRDQSCPSAQTRGGMRRFGTGMATADHDDIKSAMFHVKHSSLSKAEARENLVEQGFDIHPAKQRFQSPHGAA